MYSSQGKEKVRTDISFVSLMVTMWDNGFLLMAAPCSEFVGSHTGIFLLIFWLGCITTCLQTPFTNSPSSLSLSWPCWVYLSTRSEVTIRATWSEYNATSAIGSHDQFLIPGEEVYYVCTVSKGLINVVFRKRAHYQISAHLPLRL